MNISPTPKRYNSRGDGYYASQARGKVPEFEPYRKSGLNFNDGYSGINPPVYKNGLHSNLDDDKLVPEEIKLQRTVINDLISQNKELQTTVHTQREEIERLNIIIGQFRAKLTKYSVMNRKLEDELRGSERSSNALNKDRNDDRNDSILENSFENAEDYIQIPKLRDNSKGKQDKSPQTNDLNDRLSQLVQLLEKSQQNNSTKINSNSNDMSPPVCSSATPPERNNKPIMSSPKIRDPSEEDILCQESAELKNLENQIELVKKKLLIKRENELRKLSLENELIELMDQLSTDASPYRYGKSKGNFISTSKHKKHDENLSDIYGDYTGKNSLRKHNIKPFNPIKMDNILETPTPPNRRNSE